MHSSQIIDVAVGLLLLYALLSVAASALLELVASVLAWRAKDLESALRVMLGHTKDWKGARLQWLFAGGGFGRAPGPGSSGDAASQGKVADRILSHPLVGGAVPTKGGPSYISSKNFALAVLDVVTEDAPVTFSSVSNAVRHPGTIPEPLRRALQPLVDAADSLEAARANVERWFDSTMDRLSGLYKRRTQTWLVGFGLLLAAVLNLDSVSIARDLAFNSTRSEVVANAAQQWYAASQRDEPKAESKTPVVEQRTLEDWRVLSADVTTLLGSGLSIGWTADRVPHDRWGWIAKIIGMLMTGLTTSVGASTWFAALGRALALRSSLQPKKDDT